ncbi:MAG: anti-sigma factor [Acidobacteria bacterium]|nr:anti-sigma factor [Acidobacteriota bacterium]
MTCQEIRELIHAYLDGEIDLVRSLEIERHLPDCQVCASVVQNLQTLRSAITRDSLYHRAPPDLRQRVQAVVRQSNRAESKPRFASLWFASGRWLGVGISAAAVAVLLLALIPAWLRSSADEPIAKEAISAHVRSLMADHLTDVASSDRHTVKPWFNGRLDFSPPVTDLTERGFPLIGGRLDYLDNRPVAALVYRRQQHFINLFIWPSAQPSSKAAVNPVTQQGFHLFRWTAIEMHFLAVSDLNERELKEFVGLIHDQLTPTATP